MASFVYSAIFSLLAVTVLAQVPSFTERCPTVTTVDNFDLSKYLGVWYEHATYPSWFEAGRKCVYANYTLKSDGNVNVFNTGIKILTNSRSSIEGVAYPDDLEHGKLLVKFPQQPVNGTYWVLDTDYDNYAIVWSCSNVPVLPVSLRFAWILTRSPQPSEEVIAKANSVFDMNKISRQPLVNTVQNSCDY